MEYVVDGRSDLNKKNFKYLKPYHEALILLLLQADSVYKHAADFRPKRKMRALMRLADTQKSYLKSFQTWATGTTHFRCDVTGMNGLQGVYVKQKIIDEWDNMKRGSDSFRERFYSDMVTEDTCQGDENQRLNRRSFPSRYGESAGNWNTNNTNFKENLEMMSRDFEDATKALQDLHYGIENVTSCCWISRYFQIKRCVDRYMLVVTKVLRQRGYCA